MANAGVGSLEALEQCGLVNNRLRLQISMGDRPLGDMSSMVFKPANLPISRLPDIAEGSHEFLFGSSRWKSSDLDLHAILCCGLCLGRLGRIGLALSVGLSLARANGQDTRLLGRRIALLCGHRERGMPSVVLQSRLLWVSTLGGLVAIVMFGN